MILVDTSVVLKWFINEPLKTEAEALLAGQLGRNDPIGAPQLLRYELASALRQRVRRGFIGDELAREVFDRFLDTPIDYLPRSEADRFAMHRRALAVANQFDLPATYDAHYIALAELLDCDLWTADRRLLNGVAGRLPFVRDLASFDG